MQIKIAAYFDPAATAKTVSDFNAWVIGCRAPAWGMDVYCLHAWIRRATPEQALRHLFWIIDTFPGVRLGAERNGFQLLYWKLLQLICQREGREVPYIRPFVSRVAKEDRILRWQGEFEQGYAKFDLHEGDQQLLVNQFLDFPNGSHDDGPDAWSGMRDLLGPPAAVPMTAEEVAAAEMLERAQARTEDAEARRAVIRQAAAKRQGEGGGWDPVEDPWLDVRNDALFEAMD